MHDNMLCMGGLKLLAETNIIFFSTEKGMKKWMRRSLKILQSLAFQQNVQFLCSFKKRKSNSCATED